MTTAATLSCGCWVDRVDDSFVMRPCSKSCPNYLFVLAESARQRIPVVRIKDPEGEG